jgi:hypothetical protein
MRLFLFRLAGLVVPLLVISQLALPSFLGDRIASRLTEDGGTAEVSMGAFPALRLLTGHGDKLFIKADGLSLGIGQRRNVFQQLDDFDAVTVSVTNSRAGPFRIETFFLDQLAERDNQYRVFVTLSTSATELGRYAGEQLGGSIGGMLAGLTASAMTGSGKRIPAHVRATIDATSDPPRALAAQADVGGLPAGPLAIVVTDALLGQL